MTCRSLISAVCAALLLPTIPLRTDAQGAPPPPTSTRGRRTDDPRRGTLERRFQQRLEVVVKQRLQLNDEQMTKLREVASRTEASRRTLRADEMAARRAMRMELLAGDNANDARVEELLEQLPKLERRRLDLHEQEQKELARFLSPVQRARYFALQDELRRGMQEVQRQRMETSDSLPHGRDRNGSGGDRRRPPQ